MCYFFWGIPECERELVWIDHSGEWAWSEWVESQGIGE